MKKFYHYRDFGIILISRLKSKRLKNKAILRLNKKNLTIEYLINKITKNFKNFPIILATSRNKNDQKLVDLAKKHKINYFCGDAIDVLERIYSTSKKYNLKNILVCSGDNPLIDLDRMKKLINFHYKNKNDFSTYYKMPLGTYGWVLKFDGLKKVINLKKTKKTEIWGNFFLENRFIKSKYLTYKTKKKYSFNKRLTIDTKEDLIFVKKILNCSKKKYPSLLDIEKILFKNKHLLEINSNIEQRCGPKNVY